LKPSPTMKANTKATLATFQTLAVHRSAETHLWCLSLRPSIAHLPAIKEEPAVTSRPA
jgi:hypothetical protein